MANNEYGLSILTTLPSSVAYGATVYAPATAVGVSFSPAYGISAINVASFSASANNSNLTYAISAGSAFPKTLTWNGLVGTQFNFNIGITNTSPTVAINNSVTFSMSSYGLTLSGGVTGTMGSGLSTTAPATINALGAPVYGLSILTTLPSSVAYGATVNAPATAVMVSVNPAYSISAVNVVSFSSSANNSALTYAWAGSFPQTLTWNGTVGTQYNFNIGITNTSPDANTNNSVTFSMSSYGIALSGGVLGAGTGNNGLSTTAPATILAVGATASAVTLLSATPYSNYMRLDWHNPSDLSAVIVRRSPRVVTLVTDGVNIYQGTSSTYNDVSSIALSAYCYGVYATDTDGNVSSMASVSAMGLGPQAYPPSSDASQNLADPKSQTHETYNTRRQRMLANDEI